MGKPDKDEETNTIYFKGKFASVKKEIEEGNNIAGIALKQGQVGFMFTKDTNVDLEELITPEATTVPHIETVVKSRDGEIIESQGSECIIREIPLLKSIEPLVTSFLMPQEGLPYQKVLEVALHIGLKQLVLKPGIQRNAEGEFDPISSKELPDKVLKLIKALQEDGAEVKVEKIDIKNGGLDALKKRLGLL